MRIIRDRCLFRAMLVCIMSLVILTGCQKYEPVNLPAVEEANSGIKQSKRKQEHSIAVQSEESTEDTSASVSAFIDVDETVYVIGDQVNIRSGYTADSPIVATLGKGEALNRIGYSESWSKILYQNKECFVSSQYVSRMEPETEPVTEAETESETGSGAAESGESSGGSSEDSGYSAEKSTETSTDSQS